VSLPARVERWRSLAARVVGEMLPMHRYSPGVPLVLAVIAAESGGDPAAAARTRAGDYARGLMQVRETTARGLGLKETAQLHDPYVGLRYGVHYLARQLDRYGGKVAPAVAAYNAGTASYTEAETFTNQDYVDRVARWLKRAAPAGLAAAGMALGTLAVALLLNKRRRRSR